MGIGQDCPDGNRRLMFAPVNSRFNGLLNGRAVQQSGMKEEKDKDRVGTALLWASRKAACIPSPGKVSPGSRHGSSRLRVTHRYAGIPGRYFDALICSAAEWCRRSSAVSASD